MSGRASAAVDINTPAPMVAASATAILNDINLSTSPGRPSGAVKFSSNPANDGLAAVCQRIFNRVALTNRFPRGARSRSGQAQERKCWKQSK